MVCEEEAWLAIVPLGSAALGHTLIVPRLHVPDFWQAPPELTATLAQAASRVGRAAQRALNPDGMNLITSSGAAAEQTVRHLHLHVLPRWEGDAFGVIWEKPAKLDADELQRAAESIAAACRS